MRELRISTAIKLPEDVFAEAEIVAKIAPLVKEFGEKLAEIEKGAVITRDIVSAKPRGKKSAAAETKPAAGHVKAVA